MPWFYNMTDDTDEVRVCNGGADETATQAMADQDAADHPTWTAGDPYEQDAGWYDAQPKPKATVARRDGTEYTLMTDGTTQDIE